MASRSRGLSIPIKVVEMIDEKRGDISRSRYVLRLIEKALYEKNSEVVKDGVQTGNLDPSLIPESTEMSVQDHG